MKNNMLNRNMPPRNFLKEEFITNKEATRILGLCPRTLAKYRNEGKLGFVQFSERKYFYLKSDIESFISSRYKKNPEYLL